MEYLLDGQDIGMFDPSDLACLQVAYLRICGDERIEGDIEAGRKIARALIQLYRHGVREPDQLISAFERRSA